MARINIIAWDNNRGLRYDIRILQDVLSSLGHQVDFTPANEPQSRNRWRSLGSLWPHGGRAEPAYDLNITLEHTSPAHLRLARRNVLIPNQEWFSQRDRKQLRRYDAVLTKTRIATEIFQAQGVRPLYIGFQSVDCLSAHQEKQATFLHLAGASPMKGTERLLSVWRKYPHWPTLHVLQAPDGSSPAETAATNIIHRREYPENVAEIRELQNRHLFQICLSEAEGWGHYIVEAMSCGAIVLTSDAPPMNELVSDERGILVAARPGGTLNLATRYLFDETALIRAVERCMGMEETERARLGEAARRWYLENQRGFAPRLQTVLQQLL